MSTTGQRIRKYREDKKMLLQELSALSGVSEAGLSRIERGFREPKVATIIKLANAMGIPAWDLMKQD